MGTVGGGLNRIKPRKLRTFTTRDGLAHNVVMSLAEDAGRNQLWVGSNCGGISVRRGDYFAPFYANYLLDNECIWSLLPARDGCAVGRDLGRGTVSDARQRRCTTFPSAGRGMDEPIIALCENGQGGLWVGTMQGGLKVIPRWRVSRRWH